jgi:UDP-3-O-[3-hydroxymyristoyl] glucosamine N-acyltransferase
VSITLRQVAELVQGQLEGDGELAIAAARPLHAAQPGDITFVEGDRQAHLLAACRASAAVVPLSLPVHGLAVVRVADPLGAFVTLVRHFRGQLDETPPGLDPRACVHASARVGAEVNLYPFATVGEGSIVGDRCQLHSGVVVGRYCRLGADCVLFPNVVLYDGSVLGDRVVIHSNAVIGADGFGYRLQGGKHVKVPQLGHVEIGDDVEIGACTTIDRGTFEPTRVGAGTKIDNQVQVAHNCRIGRHNLLVSQTGIAGSSSTGDYVVVAGQVGIVDHVHIGDGALVGAKAGVTKDVPPGQRVLGAPATPERDQKRILMSLEKLPDIRRGVRRIKQHLGLGDEQAA